MQIHNAQCGERGGQKAEKNFMCLGLSCLAIRYEFYFTNLTGPRDMLADWLTTNASQFLSQDFPCCPHPQASPAHRGPQGMLLPQLPPPHPALEEAGSVLGILPLWIQNKASALSQPQLPGGPSHPPQGSLELSFQGARVNKDSCSQISSGMPGTPPSHCSCSVVNTSEK